MRPSPAAVSAGRLLAGLSAGPGLADHAAVYGALPRLPAEQLLSLLDASGLRGRGGAGFPVGRKARTVASGRRPLVVCNAMEGEPASRKDRLLTTRLPHLVLDGVQVAARAVGADQAHVAVHRGSAAALRTALSQRPGLPGEVATELHELPDRYVASEESALVHWLNGGEAKPTFTPPRPFERGVAGRPTMINNAETLAHVALLARYGDDWFREVGDVDEPGTLLLTVGTGRSAQVVEVPVGTPAGEVLAGAGWLLEELSAVLMGGYFGTWLPAAALRDVPLSHRGLQAVGGALGAGVLIPLPHSACGLVETARIVGYLARQTAGQCGPCVNGLPAAAAVLDALVAGRADIHQLEALSRWIAVVPGRGACRHPDGALRLAASALTAFPDDVHEHRAGRPCRGALAGGGLVPIPATLGDEPWR